MPWLMRDAAGLGFQTRGPMRDHWRADAALVLVLFVQAKWRIARVRPTGVVGPVGIRIPRLETASACALERARAVISAKQKQRVLPLALRLELGDDAADLGIHYLHHRRKHLHTISLPLALFSA